MTTVLWTARSSNVKTGDIPTGWVGSTVEESQDSCNKTQCDLRPWLPGRKPGDIVCYAHSGTPAMAFRSLLKRATLLPDMYSLPVAIKRRASTAKAIRVGAIGDPGVMPWGWWFAVRRQARKAKLAVLAYTHMWRQRPDLAGHAMASCDSIAEAYEAHAMGFRAAIVTREMGELSVGLTMKDGRYAIVCPAIAAKARRDRKVECNDCGLCDATKVGPSIVFPDHGPSQRQWLRPEQLRMSAPSKCDP